MSASSHLVTISDAERRPVSVEINAGFNFFGCFHINSCRRLSGRGAVPVLIAAIIFSDRYEEINFLWFV